MEFQWFYIILAIVFIDMYYLYKFYREGRIPHYYKNQILTKEDLQLLENVINCMDGREFELFCSKLFHLLGNKTELTPSSNDEGRDIIITDKNGDITFIECKAWHGDSKMVGREVLEKLIGACALYGVNKALLITTGVLHQNAFDYTDRVNKLGNYEIELWTMYDILNKAKEIGNLEVLRIAGIDKNNLTLLKGNEEITQS